MATVVFCAIYDLIVDDINDSGISLPFGIKITTDKFFKSRIIPDFAEEAIGGLEYNYLFEAPILYKIVDTEATNENKDNLLGDFLGQCKIILFDLWRIKDNCADLQMGYLCHPFNIQSEVILAVRNYSNPFVHSNLINTTTCNCTGEKQPTYFSIDEINKLSSFDEDRDIINLSDREGQKTLINSSEQKVTIASLFVQMGRATSDLAIKISLYCTALECLFTTDNKELSHKTAERSALLIGKNLSERQRIYNDVKEIYNVRSQVLHGAAIGQKIGGKLAGISKNCDDLLRQIFQKLDDSPELDIFYRKSHLNRVPKNTETLDDYFLKLLLK